MDGTSNVCVGDTPDLSMNAVPGNQCGDNTAVTAGNPPKCDLVASACGVGTMYNAAHHKCIVKTIDYGTMLDTQNFNTVYTFIYYQNPSPPDGGSAFTPVGTFTQQTA